MQYKGRPKSENIIDKRAYFGTNAVDDDYWDEDRIMDFLQDALDNPMGLMPQRFEQRAPATVEEIILYEMTRGLPWPDQTPGTGGYGVIDDILRGK